MGAARILGRSLGAVGKVEVFGQRVALPSAGIVDGGAAPDAGRAVEIEKTPGGGANGVFDVEMRVEEKGLRAGQQRVAAVQVTPSGLHHSDARIGEFGNEPAKEIRLRNEVGVKDGDGIGAGLLESLSQGAGFIALAVVPAQMGGGDAAAAPECNALGGAAVVRPVESSST